MNKEKIERLIQEKNISDFVLQCSDINGESKGFWVTADEFKDIAGDGYSFDGSSIEGFNRVSESSMYLWPDLNSFHMLPWHKNDIGNVGCFICDVYLPNGKPFEGDPRYILKKTLKKLEDMGLRYIVAAEYEFYLFLADKNGKAILDKNGEPVPIDNGKYFGINDDNGADYRRHLLHTLKEQNKTKVKTKKSHHEVGPGQQEIVLSHADALDIADQIMITKTAIKAIAKQFGFYASLMAKPLQNEAGTGMHFHGNFTDIEGKNVFPQKGGLLNLSEIALNCIAGQLKHIDEILPILACTVNSYKRLVPGYEAPTEKIWADENNRSALIRIPIISEKKLYSARAELRCADPRCNPYLAFAVLGEAGRIGIEKNLEPPDLVQKNVFEMSQQEKNSLSIKSLPSSLSYALDPYEKSKLVRETLGEHTFKYFLKAKRDECEIFDRTVTRKEREMYL